MTQSVSAQLDLGTASRIQNIRNNVTRQRTIGAAMAVTNANDGVSLESGQCPWCLEKGALDDRGHLNRDAPDCPVFRGLRESEDD